MVARVKRHPKVLYGLAAVCSVALIAGCVLIYFH